MAVRLNLVSALACVVLAVIGQSHAVAAAQVRPEDSFDPLRVMRYVSSLPVHNGQTCYGLVLADDNGIPTEVRALSDYRPSLCHAGESPEAQSQLIRWAFEAAAAAARETEPDRQLTESLPQERLADVVLPPVAISPSDLDGLGRVVIGAGLNYAEHRDEVGIDAAEDLLLFPKPVVPTGPYAPVRAGTQIGQIPARPVLLLDYEVELGLVLLEDLDLRRLPPSYRAFVDKVAFFVANDVSNRKPIILDDKTGYTRGKSHPGYLPIGPWLVSGAQLRPLTISEGEHRLRIGLEVYEETSHSGNTQTRQLAGTDQMLRGPWAIVRYLSETLENGKTLCMRDADGHPRFLHTADGIIPAGSLILTGTPGGTAIRKPGLWKKARLFLRGGLDPEVARRLFVEDAEDNIDATAYLNRGDRVESWIQTLGRQRWSVVLETERQPYGVDGTGSCEPGTQPHPVDPK